MDLMQSLTEIYKNNKKRRGRSRYLLSVEVTVVKDNKCIILPFPHHDEGKIVGIDFYSNIRGANIESFKELINQYTMKLYRIREIVMLT